jgi:hypothetical protein
MLEAAFPEKYYKILPAQNPPLSGQYAGSRQPTAPHVKRSDEPRHYPSMMQVGDNSTDRCFFLRHGYPISK